MRCVHDGASQVTRRSAHHTSQEQLIQRETALSQMAQFKQQIQFVRRTHGSHMHGALPMTTTHSTTFLDDNGHHGHGRIIFTKTSAVQYKIKLFAKYIQNYVHKLQQLTIARFSKAPRARCSVRATRNTKGLAKPAE